jgi:hypothetical protein
VRGLRMRSARILLDTCAALPSAAIAVKSQLRSSACRVPVQKYSPPLSCHHFVSSSCRIKRCARAVASASAYLAGRKLNPRIAIAVCHEVNPSASPNPPSTCCLRRHPIQRAFNGTPLSAKRIQALHSRAPCCTRAATLIVEAGNAPFFCCARFGCK